jgi:hypothetical protein
VEENVDRGNAIENVASYLYSLLPGCVPRRNLLDSKLTYEIDLVVRNVSPREHLTTHIFGRHFLVECKNWAKTVGSQEVGYFLFRMNLTRTHFGVVFSQQGISKGASGDMAASSLVQRAFHQNGAVCISVDNTDVEKIKSGKTRSFEQLLLDKIEELRFGKPKKRPRGSQPTRRRAATTLNARKGRRNPKRVKPESGKSAP